MPPPQSARSGNMIRARAPRKTTGESSIISSAWLQMKAKKTTPSRRRISFAVDREDIEVNSDWVDAVMASPTHSPAPKLPSPAEDGPFFGPIENPATDEQIT